MSKVINEFHIKHPVSQKTYISLILDEMPQIPYRKFLIRGKIYEPLPVYDAKSCIGIISEESFIGENVEFIE